MLTQPIESISAISAFSRLSNASSLLGSMNVLHFANAPKTLSKPIHAFQYHRIWQNIEEDRIKESELSFDESFLLIFKVEHPWHLEASYMGRG